MITEQETIEAAERRRAGGYVTDDDAVDDETLLIEWSLQELARIKSERAAQDEFNARVERALDTLHGPRDSYRPILTDRDKILARICSYAKRTAAGDNERRSVPVWSVISDITGHGSGVSSAIYELYRERDEDKTKGDEACESK